MSIDLYCGTSQCTLTFGSATNAVKITSDGNFKNVKIGVANLCGQNSNDSRIICKIDNDKILQKLKNENVFNYNNYGDYLGNVISDYIK